MTGLLDLFQAKMFLCYFLFIQEIADISVARDLTDTLHCSCTWSEYYPTNHQQYNQWSSVLLNHSSYRILKRVSELATNQFEYQIKSGERLMFSIPEQFLSGATGIKVKRSWSMFNKNYSWSHRYSEESERNGGKKRLQMVWVQKQCISTSLVHLGLKIISFHSIVIIFEKTK